MTTRLRPLLLTGAAATATLLFAGCGSIGADAPADATLDDFCTASADIDRSAGEFAAELAEVGTPDGVSEQVRDGFEIYVDALDDKGDQAYDLARSTLEVPEDDVEDGNAFIGYMTETCNRYFMERSPDAESGAPTE